MGYTGSIKLNICCALLISILLSSAAKAETDPNLIQALKQSTHNSQDNTTDLDSLVWLSSMSEKLVRRIPNAFYRIRLLDTVYKESQRMGLDPQLVLAVIDIESNFNRYAESHVGAQGLMQIMPFWKDVYGRPNDDLYNPQINIRYGCEILRHYMDKYQDPVRALAAYNGSLGRDKYPNKVYGRLAKTWQFTEDRYSRNTDNEVALNN